MRRQQKLKIKKEVLKNMKQFDCVPERGKEIIKLNNGECYFTPEHLTDFIGYDKKLLDDLKFN